MRYPLRTNETENEITFNSGRIFAIIRGKICSIHHNRETAKIGFCTSLKSISISGFVDTGDEVNAD